MLFVLFEIFPPTPQKHSRTVPWTVPEDKIGETAHLLFLPKINFLYLDFWPKSVTRIIKNGRHPKEDAVYEGKRAIILFLDTIRLSIKLN